MNIRDFSAESMAFQNDMEKAKKYEIKRDRRRYFPHRERGKYLIEFKQGLLNAIKEGKDVDYIYDGEDELPCEVFNSDAALIYVMEFLKKKGLLKYIKK